MGATLQLIEMLGDTVRRRVDSTMYEWMRQISTLVDSIVGIGNQQAQVRFVTKGGNDATGDGTFDNPFLTIQAAITSITDASATKQYVVMVAPGIYTNAFLLQPWIFIEGENREAVVLSPPPANWIGAGFAAAGSQISGVNNCTFGTDFLCDFAAVASPGAGQFFLTNISYAATAISATGNNVLNLFQVAGLFNSSTAFPAAACTFSNIPSSISSWVARAVPLALSNTAAYAVTMILSDVAVTNTVAVSCASTVNTLSVLCYNGAITGTAVGTGFTITGDGCTVRGIDLVRELALADANNTLDFNSFTVGAIKLINGGDNLNIITPSADRTLTINTPNARGTRLRIKNLSAFYVSLTFVGTATGGSSYIPPFGYFDAFYATNWNIQNEVQNGVVTLTNGVTAALIPADITAASSIVATLKDINGGVLGATITAKATDRVMGTRAGGGGFKLTSTTAAGVTVATDQGIYDWIVSRP
jgi:hypothetical protein